MTWMESLPLAIVAAAILYLPGLAVLLSARLPALATLAVAPAIGISVAAGSAVLAWATGATWGLGWVLATTAVLALPALLLGRRVGAQRTGGKWTAAAPDVAGIAIAALVLTPPLLAAMQGPERFSQRFDNVFHLNAIRSVLETGAGSPFSFGTVGSPGFYPAAWYDWTALTANLGSAPITAAVQVCSLVTVLAVWPIGMVWLATSVFRLGTLGRFAAGPLALSSVSFPLSFIEWGPLYPNLLGLAFAPGLIAAGWHALDRAPAGKLSLRASLALLAAGAAATLLAHPNALIASALFLIPAAVAGVVTAARRRDPGPDQSAGTTGGWVWLHGSRLWTAAVAAALLAFPILWMIAATRFGDTVRDPFLGVPHALLELATGGSLAKPPSLALLLGLLIGIAIAIRRRHYAVLAAFGILGLTYLAAATFTSHALASAFAAPFYNDPYRTGAIVAIPTIALAVLGWDTAATWLQIRFPALRTRVMGALVALAVALVTLLSPGWADTLARLAGNFTLDEDSDMLTFSELALIERIGQHVPPDGVVVVNPWHGGGLVYALTGRHVTQYFMPTVRNADVELINAELRNAATNPAVCAALAREGAEYVLVLDDHILWSVRTPPLNEGLTDLESRPGFELLDSEGDSALYRITACG